ncbi:PfaB family protein [Shewanella aestuarii]|uniref:PfaB family protein n=1 Tax=Shewanella aestuarii TaxID=1028752 RepID=A0A6G9QJ50_9GAMM|nr:PfaB family protein [Shewanella aestuarii]QIR14097.1 PfaB family protein [Shewanella aestuarii]
MSTTQSQPMRIALKLVCQDSGNVVGLNKPCSITASLMASAVRLALSPFASRQLANSAKTDSFLNQAIGQINQQQAVLIQYAGNNVGILMMPALMAAQYKCHPHAYLTAVAKADTAQASMQQALVQAKRTHIQPLEYPLPDSHDERAQFNALVALINAFALRQHPHYGHYWFTEPHQSRVASLSFVEQHNRAYTSVILVQGTQLPAPKPLINEQQIWLPISAAHPNGLITALEQLQQTLQAIAADEQQQLMVLIKQTFAQYDANACIGAVLMANSLPALLVEAQAMQNRLVDFIAEVNPLPLHYKTPAGSCVNIDQQQPQQGLCFVYPGVGTVYANMLPSLNQYFPDLYAQLERDGNLKAMLQADSIYQPDNTTAMSLGDMAIAGVGSSYLLTKLLCQMFAIKPDFAMGYSMGEAAMWASLNVWQQPETMIEQTKTDRIFTTDISGQLNCVRQLWQLRDDEQIVWNSFVVRSTAAEIEPLLSQYPRVYLAIEQGDTCVLAGCEISTKALLKQLGKRGIAANRVTAMHTPPAMLIRDDVKAFYQQPLHHDEVLNALPKQISFISAANDQPVALTSHAIADAIANTFCQPLNFTKLVQKAQGLGANLFVEVGADRQTATLIDKISRNTKPAIALNAKGADDATSLLKCIAQLVSHRVPMSLAYLTDNLAEIQQTNFAAQSVASKAEHCATTLLQGEQS